MILSLFLSAQADPARLPPAQPIPPPDFETANALVPVQALLAAFSAGDSAAMLRSVYPDGQVTGTGMRADASGLSRESWAQFAARLTPSTAFQETISDPAIEIDGDIAMVWAPAVVRVGGKVSECGFDHFDLVRDNGGWKVMNLTYSSRITGCPQ